MNPSLGPERKVAGSVRKQGQVSSFVPHIIVQIAPNGDFSLRSGPVGGDNHLVRAGQDECRSTGHAA